MRSSAHPPNRVAQCDDMVRPEIATFQMTTVVKIPAKHDVRIDRRTKWGNPFKIGRDGTREEVILKYHVYLLSRPSLLIQVHGLKDKVLGCHCHPLPCHGDVLASIANALQRSK